MTIHILRNGLPLCGFSSLVPNDWPPGHSWVALPELADCVDCGAIESGADGKAFVRAFISATAERSDPTFDQIRVERRSFDGSPYGIDCACSAAGPCALHGGDHI